MLIKSAWFPAVLALLAFSCDDAAGPPDDISGACERQRECAAASGEDLSSDRDECPDRLSAEYDEASSYGCGAAYAEWVSCQATQRGSCPPPIVIDEIAADGSGVESRNADADPCQGADDALRLCQGEAQRDE